MQALEPGEPAAARDPVVREAALRGDARAPGVHLEDDLVWRERQEVLEEARRVLHALAVHLQDSSGFSGAARV